MSSEMPPPESSISKDSIEIASAADPCPICHSIVHPDSKQWIQCDECEVWYHEVCEGLSVVPSDDNYICNSCRKKKNLPPVGNPNVLKNKTAQQPEESGERGKRRGRKRKGIDAHSEKVSVKQETTTYHSTIPNFDTVDDSVKAYCGIDYNAVYKKKKDVDMESLEQYQRREFIPGRKAFWKRYQQEMKKLQPQKTNDLLVNPLQQRKYLLSISHKCPEVDELASLSKYIVLKRAAIEVKKDPEEHPSVPSEPPTPTPTPTPTQSFIPPSVSTTVTSTPPVASTPNTPSAPVNPLPTTLPLPPATPPTPSAPSSASNLPSAPTSSQLQSIPSKPAYIPPPPFFSASSPASVYASAPLSRSLPLPTITQQQPSLSFSLNHTDSFSSENPNKRVAEPLRRSKPSRFDMPPSAHDVTYTSSQEQKREVVESRRSTYDSRSSSRGDSRHSYHRRRSDSRSSSRSDSRSSSGSYSHSRSRSSSRSPSSRSHSRSRNRSTPRHSTTHRSYHRHSSSSRDYDRHSHKKYHSYDHHRRDNYRDNYGRDSSRGRHRDY